MWDLRRWRRELSGRSSAWSVAGRGSPVAAMISGEISPASSYQNVHPSLHSEQDSDQTHVWKHIYFHDLSCKCGSNHDGRNIFKFHEATQEMNMCVIRSPQTQLRKPNSTATTALLSLVELRNTYLKHYACGPRQSIKYKIISLLESAQMSF